MTKITASVEQIIEAIKKVDIRICTYNPVKDGFDWTINYDLLKEIIDRYLSESQSKNPTT